MYLWTLPQTIKSIKSNVQTYNRTQKGRDKRGKREREKKRKKKKKTRERKDQNRVNLFENSTAPNSPILLYQISQDYKPTSEILSSSEPISQFLGI